jgi:2-polyprenyl-3-methyl-5-hydroxy-6-metoxy-1,4-benzoquinol methylase
MKIFDVTFCMETFVHLPNPQIAMNELARVTKPGELIIANVTSNKILWRIRYEPLEADLSHPH